MRVEIHFQELFQGEPVDIVVGGEVRARVEPRTDFATALAHIEPIEVREGEEVTLRIADGDVEASVRVDASTPFVVATLSQGRLTLRRTETRPGYV